ncbi:hypothetical protein [uncultured Devosia sp.]|uniref:hypothetical protein n=1 Tax=uncultured Devosia sp. TaxID=211434 RepID=UPI002637EBD3|nr:hypothetical protein [uncultured Devosia sp.]
MHDPLTQAFDIRLPWPGRAYGIPLVTIWHVDPEKPCRGQRSDDSCGWFDRRPREYADAVIYLLNDNEFMHDLKRSIATRKPVTGYHGHTFPRMPAGEVLAATLMVANYLELRRWWNGQDGKAGAHASFWLRHFTRRRKVGSIAADLALDPLDNLSATEDAEGMVRIVAACLHRRFKPWWRHPRWHVHHWTVQIHLWQTFRRWALSRCCKCGGRFAWGESPTSDCWDTPPLKFLQGEKHVYHGRCGGIGMAVPNTSRNNSVH